MGNAGNVVKFFTFTMAWKRFCCVSEVSGLIHKYNNHMIFWLALAPSWPPLLLVSIMHYPLLDLSDCRFYSFMWNIGWIWLLPTWILSLHTLAIFITAKMWVLPPYFRPWQAGTCHSTTVTCDNNLCFDFCMYAATNRPSDSSIYHSVSVLQATNGVRRSGNKCWGQKVWKQG